MLKRTQRRRQRGNPEAGWGSASGQGAKSWNIWLMLGGLLLLASAGIGVWFMAGDDKREIMQARPEAADEVRDGLETAESVARAFLAESDPAKRLQWVRNAEEVESRLGEFPEEALAGVGRIEKVLGHQGDGGLPVTAFVVELPSGNVRLLEVVGTPGGPRVDWDAYARYGTASWEKLWSGEVQRAVVRVFCQPATERPMPFEDQRKWTSFRLSGSDLPQAALGFAQAGSVREERMKRVVLATPNYRQRFTLEILRHEGKDEPLFEITRCLAVGWIADERPVEEQWEAERIR